MLHCLKYFYNFYACYIDYNIFNKNTIMTL